MSFEFPSTFPQTGLFVFFFSGLRGTIFGVIKTQSCLFLFFLEKGKGGGMLDFS